MTCQVGSIRGSTVVCVLPAAGVRGNRSGEDRSDAIAVADPLDIRDPGPPAAAADVSASTASTASSRVGSSSKL